MSVKKMTRIALFSAVLCIFKTVLEFLPNIELVSFFTIIYTLVFGSEAFIAVTVFNLFEVVRWGLGTWVISYLYVWPLLVLITLLLKKIIKEDFVMWAVVSGVFGLVFGSLFAVLYLLIDVKYAWTYFLSGLPWDIVHCVGNFIIMITLGKPMHKLLKKMEVQYGERKKD